jgi:filamentous hemagglutinin family protein
MFGMRITTWLVAIVLLCLAGSARGQIRADGSVGPVASFDGLDVQIPAGVGTRLGPTLLHSFEDFGIASGGSATFTSAGDPTPSVPISYLVARVTGGRPSAIHGRLASEVGEQHFVFVNPSGVVFGEESTIDVPGSFHVSTADELHFGQDEVMRTGFADVPIVTSSPPSAFGFLSDDPAPIAVQGRLEVERGQTLGLVGGPLVVDGARQGVLFAPGGSIRLISVASAGIVQNILLSNAEVILEGFERLGPIELVDTAIVAVDGLEPQTGDDDQPTPLSVITSAGGCVAGVNPACIFDLPEDEFRAGIDVELARGGGRVLVLRPSDFPGGEIMVRGRSMLIEDSDLRSVSYGPGGGRIDIELTGDLVLRKTTTDRENVGVLARSELREVHYVGDLAEVFQGEPVLILGEGSFINGALSESGDISIWADDVALSGGARITATSVTGGKAGSIAVIADGAIRLVGREASGEQTPSAIFANAEGDGDGGSILVEAHELTLAGGGAIIAQTTGDADGGDITVRVARLVIRDDSQIDSSTSAQSLDPQDPEPTLGRGGQIHVVASERILISGRVDADDFARISTFSKARSAGRAGDILVRTPQLEVENGAGIETTTSGPGGGGQIVLDVAVLRLDKGATISARSEGSAPLSPGNAGNIVIGPAEGLHPNRVVSLKGGSAITTSATSASGGSVFVNAGPLVEEEDGELRTAEPYAGAASGEIVLLEDSEISTSVTGGTGNGGNITIDPVFVVLNRSHVVARADAGAGGNIVIRTDFFVASADSVVDASAGPAGVDGSVLIESPVVDLVSPLASLSQEFVDASSLMRERCAARQSGAAIGSFLVSRHGPLGAMPDDYLASPPAGYQSDSGSRASRVPTSRVGERRCEAGAV